MFDYLEATGHLAEVAEAAEVAIEDQVLPLDSPDRERDLRQASSELNLPSTSLTQLQRAARAELINVHAVFARAVAPATPGALLYLYEHQSEKHYQDLGPFGRLAFRLGFRVPLTRKLASAAILFLLLFLLAAALAATADADDQTTPATPTATVIVAATPIRFHETLLSDAEWSAFRDHGFELFYFLCAAGLGACFVNLFLAMDYIHKGSYDPKYEGSYWMRLILGIIAGVILAEIIPIDDLIDSDFDFGGPLLALLGGYAAVAVRRVLDRIVYTLEALIHGSSERSLSSLSQEVRTAFDAERLPNYADIYLSAAKTRTAVDDVFFPNRPPQAVRAALDDLLGKIERDRPGTLALRD